MEQPSVLILEYYQLTFRNLLARHNRVIQEALLEQPRELRRAYFHRHQVGTVFRGQEAFDAVRPYLDRLEHELRQILCRHSIHYWIHLYRRLSPRLVSLHDAKNDSMTIRLVRDIAECAIAKYGRLKGAKDLHRSSEVSPDRILGGRFLRLLQSYMHDPAARNEHLRHLRASGQFVICDFELKDFIAIHRVEGLAYEYWLTTAILRALGKGDTYVLMDNYRLMNRREPDLGFLIDQYDKRLYRSGFATLPGTFLSSDLKTSLAQQPTIFTPAYNADGWRADELLETLGLAAADDLSLLNFVPSFIQAKAYLQSHAYLADRFEQRRSYRLDSLVLMVAALSLRVLMPETYLLKASEGDATAEPLAILTALKRAYCMVEASPDSVIASAHSYLQDVLGTDEHRAASVLRDSEKIRSDLTLDSQDKQARISLWTRGPRFMLLPGHEALMVDAQGVLQLLQTLFVGVRHSEQGRGMSFEQALRSELERRNFTLEQRWYEFADGPREVDAAVRAGTTLWLIEAHSMERPLDFEIGKADVITMRNQRFAAKLEQVASVRQQLEQARVGKNYDVSWATRIEHCVASPFVEWIWTREAHLWIDGETPRVLSVSELFDRLQPVASESS